jgi:hypothetical protein
MYRVTHLVKGLEGVDGPGDNLARSKIFSRASEECVVQINGDDSTSAYGPLASGLGAGAVVGFRGVILDLDL